MKIKIGATRMVIVLNEYKCAYKIARFRPIKTVLKVFQVSIFSKQCWVFFEKYGACNLLEAFSKYLFAGFYANHLESNYSQNGDDQRVNAVQNSYLFGFIITQPAAEFVSTKTILADTGGAARLFNLVNSELTSPKQFGRNQLGSIVIVDYGSPLTLRVLKTSMNLK